jgi:hypothetical protein
VVAFECRSLVRRGGGVKAKPNFIIGGTAAGGTSFLSTTLVQHPQIYLPREMRPEPLFFYKSWEYEKGLAYYFKRWFSDVPSGCLAIGERSSSYLFGGKSVAEKIAAVFPDMKFVFTLRNPVERTWANYRYTVLQGLEDLSFMRALKEEDQRIKKQCGIWAEIQPYNYTGRGYYGAQLSGFLEIFPRENILTIKSEDLSGQADVELRKIYRFLGLTDLDFVPRRSPDHSSVNVVNPSLQMELRGYFKDRFDKVIEAVRKEDNLSQFIVDEKDRIAINKLRENMKGEKEKISEESRSYLQNLFEDDLKLVKDLVDFDIDDWK